VRRLYRTGSPTLSSSRPCSLCRALVMEGEDKEEVEEEEEWERRTF